MNTHRRMAGRICVVLCLVMTSVLSPFLTIAYGTDAGLQHTEEPMTISVLDVGQGLSVLVQHRGQTLLYDGGGRESSSFLVSYLRNEGIHTIDWMISSHYDSDHLSGLIGVLHNCTVFNVLCGDYDAGSALQESFQRAAEQTQARMINPKPGRMLKLGDAVVTVLAPKSYQHSKENDNSIAVRIDYGGFSCLITGDAESASEKEMMESGLNLQADVYIVGHHGSASSSSSEFLNAICPKTVIISCSLGNDWGFPTQEALERIREQNAQLYRTDLQGTIQLTTDGTQFRFMTAPTDNWEPGTVPVNPVLLPLLTEEEQGVSTESTEDRNRCSGSETEEITYVLNTKSHKFHEITCSSVGKMSENNTQLTTKTREELIEEGYQPCGSCHP